MDKRLTVKEIASRIDAYYKRFEYNQKINQIVHTDGFKEVLFYESGCTSSGRHIMIKEKIYQPAHSLTKEEALAFLAWLDAGNTGTIYTFRHQNL